MAPLHPELRPTCELLCTTPVVHMGSVIVLLYTLTLALRSSLYDCLGKECQKLADRTSLVERETRDI